jgi:lactoylglutathione lyase
MRSRRDSHYLVDTPKQEEPMSEHQVKLIILSTDDLDESIRFYDETLGMSLKFRDGTHFAALDGGPVTLGLATEVDHPIPGQVVVGIKTNDVDAAAKAVEASGGGIVRGPYDDAHERRAVVYDNKGNGIVFYKPLGR